MPNTDPSRRPPAPLHALSRRTLWQALCGGLAGAAFMFAGGKRAAAQSKTSQKVAKYQDHPNKGKSCSMCRYFLAPASCQLVDGKIAPTGWCSFFAQKS